jgi:single-strand DNA-binding protein
MNQLTFSGNLTRDPVIRSEEGKRSWAAATVAVQRDYKNKETGKYEPDYIQFQTYGSTADFLAKYFHKGDGIEVIGQQRSKIEEAEDRKITVNYNIAEKIKFVPKSGKSTGGINEPNTPAAQDEIPPAPMDEDEDDDDLPF